MGKMNSKRKNWDVDNTAKATNALLITLKYVL